MIVLRHEGNALDVPSAQSHESLAGLKLKVRLITDEPLEPIDLICAIGSTSDARIERATYWKLLRRST